MPGVPEAVAAAITYVASASAAVAAGTATMAQMATVFAVNAGISVGLNAIGGALGKKNKLTRDPTEWSAGLDNPLPFPVGERVAFAGFVINESDGYGPDNRYQSVVSVLARSGPIDGWIAFKSNDQTLNFDGNGKVTTGDHKDEYWIQRRVGDQPSTALTSPAGLVDGATIPDWGSTHKLNGAAAVMLTYAENSKFTEWPGGKEKPLHIFRGLKGWDPRLDSTYPGGFGYCRLNDPATWVLITEGCIWGLNWSIGRWEGDSGGGKYGVPYQCSQVGGIGASLAAIDVESFVYGANVADLNGWKMAGIPDTSMDEAQVLAMSLQASGCFYSHDAGLISCVSRGAPQASLVTVTARDTAGPIELSLGPSRLERKNTITPRFWSEAHGWQITPIEAISNPDWLAEDRGYPRGSGLDFPYVPAADQAAQLGYYELADAREPLSGTVPFKPHVRRIKPGDCFTFAEPGFILDGVKVKAGRRITDPMTGTVRLAFRQETDAKHDAAMAQVGVTPPETTPGAPPPLPLGEPTYMSVVPSGDTISITTRGPDDPRFDHVNVYRSIDSASFGDAVHILTLTAAPFAFVSGTDTATVAGAYRYWFRSANAAETLVSTPITGPVGPIPITGASPALNAWLAECATEPGTTFKNALRTLIAGLQDSGAWAQIDRFAVGCAHDAQAATVDLKDPTKRWTPTGGVTFTALRGWTGDGTTGFIDSGQAASALTYASLNSIHLMAAITAGSGSNGAAIGSASDNLLRLLASASNFNVRLNDATSDTTAVGGIIGRRYASRLASSDKRKFRDGAQVGTTQTTASTALGTGNIVLLHHDNTLFSNQRIGVASIGGGLSPSVITAMDGHIATFLTAIGAPIS